MAVKDINKASKFRFINTENFEDDVYYIEKIMDKKQYLTVHSSNIRDRRDNKSFYVHLRYKDHKRTKWKFFIDIEIKEKRDQLKKSKRSSHHQ